MAKKVLFMAAISLAAISKDVNDVLEEFCSEYFTTDVQYSSSFDSAAGHTIFSVMITIKETTWLQRLLS